MKSMKTDVRIERKSINANRTRHRIVAGFPGVGKSTAAYMNPYKFIDMESSYYHWIFDESNGTKVCHPKWPMNYVDAIIEAATNTFGIEDMVNIVAISTHKEVLDELSARGIYFDAVCPNSKDIYIQRYIDRGNNEEFVKLLQDKFESFVQDVATSNAGTVYFTDGYFADLFYDKKDKYINKIIINNLNSNVFPINYTDKIIVAVWPVGMASEIDVEPAHDDKSMSEHNNPYPFVHHARIETIRESFVEPLTEKDEAYLADCYYGYAKALAESDQHPEIKFVAVDAYPAIIDKLSDEQMNYILLVPNTYEKYAQYSSDPMSEEEFDSARDELMNRCFHTIISNMWVPLCFDSASERLVIQIS